jgi:flagellar biosynthesis/type III secretory pathway M-ring protein FliF/YscJ
MQTFLNDFLTQLKGIWSRLDGGQRLVVGAVLLAAVVGFGGIVWFAGQPSYEILRTAQTTEEVSKIRQALEQANISFNIDATGRAFLVDREKIGLANLALGEAGFDGNATPAFGTSIIDDAETKAFKLNNAQVAIAQNAILKLEGVAAVTVTASAPRRRSAYLDRDRENRPSASVALRLRAGWTFESVAHSAASLAASQLMVPIENIEVFNAAGTQRYRYDPDRDAGAGSGEFFAMQNRMTRDLTSRAQELLDRLWPGKQMSVSVAVELDPSWEERREKVLPTDAIVKNEKTVKDITDSSKPEAVAGDASATSTNTKKNETKERDFVTEIGERRIGRFAPQIKRVSVAVVYDKALAEVDGFKPEELGNAVKTIVGWDPIRDKDAFSMLAAEFESAPEVASVGADGGFVDSALRWGPTVGQILGVVVVVLFLRGLFKRSSSVAATQAAAPAKAVEIDEETLPPEDQQKRMRREIERSISSDPAALAKMLESWLMEQKT